MSTLIREIRGNSLRSFLRNAPYDTDEVFIAMYFFLNLGERD